MIDVCVAGREVVIGRSSSSRFLAVVVGRESSFMKTMAEQSTTRPCLDRNDVR